MSDEKSRPGGIDPREALSEVDGASIAMVRATEAPRGFMPALVLVVSSVVALYGVAPWPVLVGIGSLLVPMLAWYLLVMRRRPRPRPIRRHSGPYVLYALLLMFVMQAARFWEPKSSWEVAAKWMVVLVICWYAMSRMRAATVRSRLEDAHGRPI